uniref:Mesothelin n=1 Tax=Latimeria chalumnae TaxID=7897 RepID=H3A4P9_LATCH
LIYHFSTSKLNSSNCRGFFKIAGRGNLNVLNRRSEKRIKLLNEAYGCLGITNSVSKDDVAILNNLVCGLSGSIIGNSDPSIMNLLKNCELTSDQESSVTNLLINGNTTLGHPSNWNIITLKSLGKFPLYFKDELWYHIKQDTKYSFLKYFMEQLNTDGVSTEIKAKFLSTFVRKQSARGAGCTIGNITRSTILESDFPVNYETAQFKFCLDNDVLVANLADMANKALPDAYLQIVKNKLDQVYPGGAVPEDQLKLLRSIAHSYTVSEIENWNITSIDTLAALMDSKDPVWEDSKVKVIITRYLQSGGKLDAITLNTIGGPYLCTLDDSQINSITSANLRDAHGLVISSCSQSKENILYHIAKSAFADKINNSVGYYNLIRSYLGNDTLKRISPTDICNVSGAPASDLETLAKSNISMDIDTFIQLNPSEVMKLHVNNVRSLLGVNLKDLKEREADATIRSWIQAQNQSDLDTLYIGLRGGPTGTGPPAPGPTGTGPPAPGPTGT